MRSEWIIVFVIVAAFDLNSVALRRRTLFLLVAGLVLAVLVVVLLLVLFLYLFFFDLLQEVVVKESELVGGVLGVRLPSVQKILLPLALLVHLITGVFLILVWLLERLLDLVDRRLDRVLAHLLVLIHTIVMRSVLVLQLLFLMARNTALLRLQASRLNLYVLAIHRLLRVIGMASQIDKLLIFLVLCALLAGSDIALVGDPRDVQVAVVVVADIVVVVVIVVGIFTDDLLRLDFIFWVHDDAAAERLALATAKFFHMSPQNRLSNYRHALVA